MCGAGMDRNPWWGAFGGRAVPLLAPAGTCHSFQSTSSPPRRGFSSVLHKILAISPPFPFLLDPVIPTFTSLAPTFLLDAERETTGGRQTGCALSLTGTETQRNWPQGPVLLADPCRTDRICQRKMLPQRWGDVRRAWLEQKRSIEGSK